MQEVISSYRLSLGCLARSNEVIKRHETTQSNILFFQAGRPKCPLDPFFIMRDKVRCHDFQILKLQEAPDSVPHGEMPRHMQLFVDRFLCDRVVPGNRVTVLGIYSIKKTSQVRLKLLPMPGQFICIIFSLGQKLY